MKTLHNTAFADAWLYLPTFNWTPTCRTIKTGLQHFAGVSRVGSKALFWNNLCKF